MNSRRGNIFNFNSNVLLTWKIKYYTQVNGIYEIPGDEWMSSDLLSRVWIVFLNPQSASTSLIFIFMTRLSSCLWKTGCSFKSSTIITSPGSSPGSWSPSPWNVIFCPSFIPVIKTIIHILLERLLQITETEVRVSKKGLCSSTFVNVDFKNLLLALYFVSIAVFAAVLGVEPLSLSLAIWAHALNLLDHSGSNLLYLYLNPSSFASWAFFNCAFFASITCNHSNLKFHILNR